MQDTTLIHIFCPECEMLHQREAGSLRLSLITLCECGVVLTVYFKEIKEIAGRAAKKIDRLEKRTKKAG